MARDYAKMLEIKAVKIYVATMAGQHIGQAALAARTAGCDFFIFNGYVVPASYPDLPLGVEYQDYPKLSEWFLRGDDEGVQAMAATRRTLEEERRKRDDEVRRRYEEALASLTPAQREGLGL
jgi:hypothetical protein